MLACGLRKERANRLAEWPSTWAAGFCQRCFADLAVGLSRLSRPHSQDSKCAQYENDEDASEAP